MKEKEFRFVKVVSRNLFLDDAGLIHYFGLFV